jgi:hypothetical protein
MKSLAKFELERFSTVEFLPFGLDWTRVAGNRFSENKDLPDKNRKRKRGKTPGTQVQHTLVTGTMGTEFRHFLASDCGTVWTITKSARTFAPIAPCLATALI